jgi:uncharacterized protein
VGRTLSANRRLAGSACGKRRCTEGPTFTFEDDRFAYDEQRYVTLGLLEGVAVSLVHTETPSRIHVISFRKATRHEEAILFSHLQN